MSKNPTGEPARRLAPGVGESGYLAAHFFVSTSSFQNRLANFSSWPDVLKYSVTYTCCWPFLFQERPPTLLAGPTRERRFYFAPLICQPDFCEKSGPPLSARPARERRSTERPSQSQPPRRAPSPPLANQETGDRKSSRAAEGLPSQVRNDSIGSADPSDKLDRNQEKSPGWQTFEACHRGEGGI